MGDFEDLIYSNYHNQIQDNRAVGTTNTYSASNSHPIPFPDFEPAIILRSFRFFAFFNRSVRLGVLGVVGVGNREQFLFKGIQEEAEELFSIFLVTTLYYSDTKTTFQSPELNKYESNEDTHHHISEPLLLLHNVINERRNKTFRFIKIVFLLLLTLRFGIPTTRRSRRRHELLQKLDSRIHQRRRLRPLLLRPNHWSRNIFPQFHKQSIKLRTIHQYLENSISETHVPGIDETSRTDFGRRDWTYRTVLQ